MKNPIWLWSGFLGNESHWGDFPEQLALNLGYTAEWVDWAREVNGAKDLPEAARFMAQKAMSTGTRPIVIGYSMGGRLALQAAVEAPGSFSQVIALSANLGLESPQEREERVATDREWAKLLQHDPKKFWKKWNQQEVLQQTQLPPLPQFDTKLWADLLVNLSTGTQADLSLPLAASHLPPRALVMGERDRKYVEQLRRASASVETHVVVNAGHRLPLDQPKELAKWIAHFIRTHQDTL